jgi:putative DNA primase/helicase
MIDRPDIVLAKAGIQYRTTARGELEFNCPLCGHARAAVNGSTGLFNCFACGKGGGLSTVLREFNGNLSTPYTSKKPAKTPSGNKIEHKYLTETGYHFASVCRQYYTDGSKSIWSKAHNGFTEAQKRDMFTRYIYNLPQVLDAIQFDGRVYIVEGEKCADALALHISTAAVTCNPGGAGKWTDQHSAWFSHIVPADVVVFPDNDAPGRLHVEQVANSLYRTCPGIKIQIIPLPDLKNKQDVADWIAK